MQKYNFVDLFSGAGGLLLGFQNAGFKCVQSIDNGGQPKTINLII